MKINTARDDSQECHFCMCFRVVCNVLKNCFKMDLVHKQVESERVVLYPAFCESLTHYVFV